MCYSCQQDPPGSERPGAHFTHLRVTHRGAHFTLPSCGGLYHLGIVFSAAARATKRSLNHGVIEHDSWPVAWRVGFCIFDQITIASALGHFAESAIATMLRMIRCSQNGYGIHGVCTSRVVVGGLCNSRLVPISGPDRRGFLFCTQPRAIVKPVRSNDVYRARTSAIWFWLTLGAKPERKPEPVDGLCGGQPVKLKRKPKPVYISLARVSL